MPPPLSLPLRITANHENTRHRRGGLHRFRTRPRASAGCGSPGGRSVDSRIRQAARRQSRLSAVRRSLITPDVDVIFHLASLVSGGAEQNFELGNKVNFDATRDLLEACRLTGHRPKFIFTSSIAVYGGELPEPVTDDTPASPAPVVRRTEADVRDPHRRVHAPRLRRWACAAPADGDGALRHGEHRGLGWASAIIREPLAGRDYVCP